MVRCHYKVQLYDNDVGADRNCGAKKKERGREKDILPINNSTGLQRQKGD